MIKVEDLKGRVAHASTPKEKEDLHEELTAVHSQLVLLLHWTEVNFVAVAKILKKHGKGVCCGYGGKCVVLSHSHAHAFTHTQTS